MGLGLGWGCSGWAQWPAPLTALCCALADWERGSCDILIKIYGDGKGTSWLQQQQLGTQVWLSKPMKTLSVPSLVLDSSRMSNNSLANHEGVLLVLAGTGIVAAAQVPQCVSRQVSKSASAPHATSSMAGWAAHPTHLLAYRCCSTPTRRRASERVPRGATSRP